MRREETGSLESIPETTPPPKKNQEKEKEKQH